MLPIGEARPRLVRVKPEQLRDVRGPLPLVGAQIPFEPPDAAGDLGEAKALFDTAQPLLDMVAAVLCVVHRIPHPSGAA